MAAAHFTLQDLLGSLLAVLFFGCVFYAPGYVLAYATDIFGFRRTAFAARSMWAIGCSLCLAPIAAYALGRVAGLDGVCWMFAASALLAVILIFKDAGRMAWPRQDRTATALIAAGWTVFVLAMLVDVQVGRKLYFSVVMADQSYRIAFTDAVVRTGIPPANPLYFAGAVAPMRYYYFWYMLCAAVVKLAHVSARQAFLASSVWAGFGLLATLHLYGRNFFRWGRRQRWIAAALLLIGGADLLPAAGNAALQSTWNGDVEWWSVDPVDAWPDSLLWVPHHVAGVLCCLLCFLLLWRTREPIRPRDKRWAVGLAAMAFASSFGLSVYVAFGFAVLMAAWLLRSAAARERERHALWRRCMAATLVSAGLLAPFVLELARGSAHAAGVQAAPPLSLSVRRMIDSGLLTGLPVFAAWNQSHPVLLDQTIRLALLLPGLAMELGVYGAIFVLLWRCRRSAPSNEARDTAFYLALCGLVLTMFVSSSVISNNDFGYRAVMLPQFFLLLLTADVLGSWWGPGDDRVVAATPGRRRLVYALLGLGAVGTLYGALLLRLWLPLEARSAQSGFSQLPQDAFEVRAAFATLDKIAPRRAVVAISPLDPTRGRKDEVIMPNEFYQRMLVMDAGRQMLNGDWKCATQFGGDPEACSAIRSASVQLYAAPAPDAAWTNGFCERFGVQYLAVGHRDVDWPNRTGWMTSLPVVVREPGFELLQCGRPLPR